MGMPFLKPKDSNCKESSWCFCPRPVHESDYAVHVQTEATGINPQIGGIGNAGQHFALFVDGFVQRIFIVTQRMASAGGTETLEQRFMIGIEKDNIAQSRWSACSLW